MDLDREGRQGAGGLSADERLRAARLPRPRARRRWVASRRALREVLSRYLARRPAEIELAIADGGKPTLADPGVPLRFNLSHTGGLALVAVAEGRQVGVDVERIDPRRKLAGLAKRALDPAAAAAVLAAPPEQRAASFHQAWTRQEALVKCLGSGLRRPRPSTPVALAALAAGPGFAGAVAIAAETMPTLRLFALAAEPRRPPVPCLAHGRS